MYQPACPVNNMMYDDLWWSMMIYDLEQTVWSDLHHTCFHDTAEVLAKALPFPLPFAKVPNDWGSGASRIHGLLQWSPLFVNLMIVQVPCLCINISVYTIHISDPQIFKVLFAISLESIYCYIPSISVLHSWFHFLKPIMMIDLNNSHHVFSRIYLMISPQQIPNEWLVTPDPDPPSSRHLRRLPPSSARGPGPIRLDLTGGHKFTTHDWERFIHTMVYNTGYTCIYIYTYHTIINHSFREWFIHTTYKNNHSVGKTIINHSFRELYIHSTYEFMVMAGGWCRWHWESTPKVICWSIRAQSSHW